MSRESLYRWQLDLALIVDANRRGQKLQIGNERTQNLQPLTIVLRSCGRSPLYKHSMQSQISNICKFKLHQFFARFDLCETCFVA